MRGACSSSERATKSFPPWCLIIYELHCHLLVYDSWSVIEKRYRFLRVSGSVTLWTFSIWIMITYNPACLWTHSAQSWYSRGSYKACTFRTCTTTWPFSFGVLFRWTGLHMRVLVERTLLGRSRLLSTSAKFHYTSIAWILSVSTLVLFCCDYAACTSTDNSRNASTEIGVLQSGKQTTGMLSTSLNNDTQHCNCSKACLLRKYHLTFCQKIELDKIVDRLAQQFNRTTCLRHFTSLVKENDRARREFKKFDDIMGRVDCTSKYSVRWNCSDCLVSYFKCMSLLMYRRDKICYVPDVVQCRAPKNDRSERIALTSSYSYSFVSWIKRETMK